MSVTRTSAEQSQQSWGWGLLSVSKRLRRFFCACLTIEAPPTKPCTHQSPPLAVPTPASHCATPALSTATLLAAAAADVAPSCDAVGIVQAALAPAGGLPSDWLGSLDPRMLVFQALADFTYDQDFAAPTKRRSVGPCLSAWGVKRLDRITIQVCN